MYPFRLQKARTLQKRSVPVLQWVDLQTLFISGYGSTELLQAVQNFGGSRPVHGVV